MGEIFIFSLLSLPAHILGDPIKKILKKFLKKIFILIFFSCVFKCNLKALQRALTLVGTQCIRIHFQCIRIHFLTILVLESVKELDDHTPRYFSLVIQMKKCRGYGLLIPPLCQSYTVWTQKIRDVLIFRILILHRFYPQKKKTSKIVIFFTPNPLLATTGEIL